MINLHKVHEKVVFDLSGQQELSLPTVQPVLESMGFVLIDDFASLKRTDKVEPWQSRTLAHCNFLAAGSEVYPDESVFNSLRFFVLVASLPKEQVMMALHIIFDVADRLQLGAIHASQPAVRADISTLIEGWTAEIFAETGDACGSESVAILISMEYDKRRI